MEDLKEKTDGDEGLTSTGAEDSGEGASEKAPAKKSGGFGKGGRSVELTVAPLKLQRVDVKLVGITPLLVNHFNNKGVGLTEMRAKQMGVPVPKKREPKDPVRCFKDSLYCEGEPKVFGTVEDFIAGKAVIAVGKFFLPFGMFKGAIETAALTADGVNKASVQRAVRIVQNRIAVTGTAKLSGDPTRDQSPEAQEVFEALKAKALTAKAIKAGESMAMMEEDVVRLKDIGRTADLRYRARFDEWSAQFTVEFLADVMNAQTVINLFNRAGFTSGLGEWRPEKGGEMGRFKMETADE